MKRPKRRLVDSSVHVDEVNFRQHLMLGEAAPRQAVDRRRWRRCRWLFLRLPKAS